MKACNVCQGQFRTNILKKEGLTSNKMFDDGRGGGVVAGKYLIIYASQ